MVRICACSTLIRRKRVEQHITKNEDVDKAGLEVSDNKDEDFVDSDYELEDSDDDLFQDNADFDVEEILETMETKGNKKEKAVNLML
jgi:hypothetical protein